jgi:hypothetical protein
LTSILEGCHMFGEGMELSKLHLVNDFRGVSSTCKEIRTGRRDTCRCSNNFRNRSGPPAGGPNGYRSPPIPGTQGFHTIA